MYTIQETRLWPRISKILTQHFFSATAMSTANAGIILLLRYCTTGVKVMHMITPLQTSQVTSIDHCSLGTGDHDPGSVQFKHHFTFCRFAMILHLMLILMHPKTSYWQVSQRQKEKKNDLHLVTSLEREKNQNGGQRFLELCSYVHMWADPCLSMAVHRQMVSCKIAQLSCNNSRGHVRQDIKEF
jgi:hypothetical protein